jgi:hypothetical protein
MDDWKTAPLPYPNTENKSWGIQGMNPIVPQLTVTRRGPNGVKITEPIGLNSGSSYYPGSNPWSDKGGKRKTKKLRKLRKLRKNRKTRKSRKLRKNRKYT